MKGLRQISSELLGVFPSGILQKLALVSLGLLMQGTRSGGKKGVTVTVNVIYPDRHEPELLVQNEVSEEYVLSPGNSLGCLLVPVCLSIVMNGNYSNCNTNIV